MPSKCPAPWGAPWHDSSSTTPPDPNAIDLSEHEGRTLYVCACGLSRAWPACDGSHKVTRDEEPGVVYRYEGDAAGGARCVV